MTMPTMISRTCSRAAQLALVSAVLCGCGTHTDATGGALDTSANVLRASFSGDINQQVTFRGDDVEIGYLPTGKGAFFSIGGSKVVAGRKIGVTLGPLAGIELKPGPIEPQNGFLRGGFASYGPEDQPDDYASATFVLFYDTTPDTSGSASTLVLTKVDKEPSSDRLLVRYHLVGRFTVHTAHAPAALSEACIREGIEAGGRHPMYNAKLCQATRADVDASFDVRVELPAVKA